MSIKNRKKLYIFFLVFNIFIVSLNFFLIRSKDEVNAQCMSPILGIPTQTLEATQGNTCASTGDQHSTLPATLCYLTLVEHQDDKTRTDNLAECHVYQNGDHWTLHAGGPSSGNGTETCIRCKAECMR